MEINLSASQLDAMEELRRRMFGHMDAFKTFDQTFVLYRFLKARNWDLNKAEIMLKKSAQFRKKLSIDTLMQDFQPREVMKMFIANFHIGYDKEGCQVLYVPIGRIDMKGLLKATKQNEFEKTIIKLFSEYEYQLEQRSKEMKRWLSGLIMIFDMTDLTFATATYRKGIEILLRLASILQDNAPERLKTVFIINAPSIFTIVYNILQNFLDAETFRKFVIYEKEGWQEELLKVIDADQLPVFMGGTRTDPDGNPLCKTILNQMGKVDERFYLTKKENPLANSPGVKKLHLMRASSTKIPLCITKSGSVIKWEFETKGGDISFGLFYNDSNEAEEQVSEVFPLERVNAKDFIESGIYECEKPGYYYMLFDNSYSWFRSKELFYRIQILSRHEFHDNTQFVI